jgi:hypothetical protein
MSEENQLEDLIVPESKIELGGETLTVTPIRAGKLPALIRAVRPIMPYLAQEQIDFMALIDEGGEHLLDAVALALGKPRAFVDALDAAELIRAARCMIEVNVDFFIHRLLPEVAAAAQKIQDLRGRISSSASSAPATDTTMSSATH